MDKFNVIAYRYLGPGIVLKLGTPKFHGGWLFWTSFAGFFVQPQLAVENLDIFDGKKKVGSCSGVYPTKCPSHR